MSCGLDRGCIERGISETLNRYERETRSATGEVDFAALEARLAREAGHASDGVIDRSEVDVLVNASGTGDWVTRGPIAGGMMGEFDADRSGGITAREWAARRARR